MIMPASLRITVISYGSCIHSHDHFPCSFLNMLGSGTFVAQAGDNDGSTYLRPMTDAELKQQSQSVQAT